MHWKFLLACTIITCGFIPPCIDAGEALHVQQPIIHVGKVKAGLPLTANFELVNTSISMVEIKNVGTSCGCQVPELSRKQLQANEKSQLTVRLRTLGQAEGPQNWKVSVVYQQAGKQTEETLPLEIRGEIIREIAVEPVQLSAMLTGESPWKAQIAIKDLRNGKNLQIKRVVSSLGTLESAVIGQSVELREQSNWLGHHKEVLQLVTDDVDYPLLEIPFQFQRQAKASVAFSPEVLTLRGAGASGRVVLRSLVEDRPLNIREVKAQSDFLKVSFASANQSGAIKVTLTDKVKTAGMQWLTVELTEPTPQTITIQVRWEVP